MKVRQLLLLLICFQSTAQNLVPNPSFEEYIRCPRLPSNRAQDFVGKNWHSCSAGTPDYYNSCSKDQCGVPNNWAGVAPAHSGKGYAGIFMWTANSEYGEYLQCEFVKPLQKEVTYCVEFYFRYSSYSVYAINWMSCLVTDLRVNVKTGKLIPLSATHEKLYKISDVANDWQHFQFHYRANGGERFIVLGNFVGNLKIKHERNERLLGKSPMLSASAYCYFDDVSVEVSHEQLPPPKPEPPYFTPQAAKPNIIYRLRYVFFDFDKSELKTEAYEELDEVTKLLKRNPSWRLELAGHTDDVGSNAYNLPLSEERARSVGNYIFMTGVSEERMSYLGFGNTKPLENDTTEEARTKNRRVEIRFLDK
ncbi:MAG: hypothetical protein CRN43_17530 [Candidatus Nephrothrix sp. EaCA]|nr:MAG: hypothetical protein CRN43_17530 [Candidatus Nephrothrix sp. EaCA]